MSRRILKAGFSVKAFDVDFQRVRAAGLLVASSLSDLARSAQFVFTMIPDDAALEELVLGALGNEMQNGQVLIDMSTVSPAASQRCASRLDKAGVDYVRAPVSGSTVLTAAGKLTIMASGPPSEATIGAAIPGSAELGVDEKTGNLSVALGHPLGMSGARLTDTTKYKHDPLYPLGVTSGAWVSRATAKDSMLGLLICE